MDKNPLEDELIRKQREAKSYDIQTLSHPDFEPIRFVRINGEPWFNGKDVMRVLKHSNANAAIKRHVDPENINYAKFPTGNGTQTMVIVNRMGLIELVFGSKMNSSREFQKWILSEITEEKITTDDSKESYTKIESGNDPYETDMTDLTEIPQETITEPLGNLSDADTDDIIGTDTTNAIRIFNNPEFAKVRAMMIDGEPYFAGKDTALALGYEINSIGKVLTRHINVKDKRYCQIDSTSGKQITLMINESGLYSLVLHSNLPTAQKFQHWITSEVIPSLRKTGLYIMPNARPTMEQTNSAKPSVSMEDCLEIMRLVKDTTPAQLSVMASALRAAGFCLNDVTTGQYPAETQILEHTESGNTKHKVKKDPNAFIDEYEQKQLQAALASESNTRVSKLTKLSRTLIIAYQNGQRIPRRARYEQIMKKLAENNNEAAIRAIAMEKAGTVPRIADTVPEMFSNPTFGTVRAIKIDDEPWLVARDITRILKYDDIREALKTFVPNTNRMKRLIVNKSGNAQMMHIVDEDGLDELILNSDLTTKKRFQNWVYDEIMPALQAC